VIPVFDAEDYLEATLASVLEQEGVELDVVVVDDGSRDGTPDLLERYADRVRSVRIENSGGPSRPRNVGVEHARGDLVALFDADDLMLPGKLARATEVLAGHPDVGMLCTDFRVIDAEGVLLEESLLSEYRKFRNCLEPTDDPTVHRMPAGDAWRHLLRTNFVGTSSVVARRDVLTAVGGFNESYKNADDIDMWIRIARAGHDLVFVDEIHHAYRRLATGVTARGALRSKSKIAVYEENRAHATDPEDRELIAMKLRSLWCGYGWALRRDGRRQEAVQAYQNARREGEGWRAQLGLLRSRLGI